MANFEQFANNASTILNMSGNLSSVATSLVVSSSTGFPAGGNFRILIDAEIILVTGVSGTTWTITRGAESTTAASHLNGATVTHILTAASLRLSTLLVGTTANLPAAADANRVYTCTDSDTLFVDNGSAWQGYGPLALTNPGWVDSGFSWTNQGSATWTKTNAGGVMTVDSSNTTNLRIRSQSVPGSGSYSINVQVKCNVIPVNSNETGAGVFISDGTKYVIMGIGSTTSGSGIQCFISYWNGANSFNTHKLALPGVLNGWVKIYNDLTSVHFLFSVDGLNWFPLLVMALSALESDSGMSAPTTYGYFGLGVGSGTSGQTAAFNFGSLTLGTS